MKLFLSDLWADLREKRMWPVAALLLAGLIAVPLVVAKPAKEPAPAPAVPVQAKVPDTALAKVQAAEDEPAPVRRSTSSIAPIPSARRRRSSTRRRRRRMPPTAAVTPATGTDSSKAGGETTGSGETTISGGSGDGGSGSDGSGDGGSTTPAKPKTTTQEYTYVVDLTYTHEDRSRKVKGMQKLEMLPSQSNPLLIFLGVDAKHENAVFLVDSTLAQTGEGSCKPTSDGLCLPLPRRRRRARLHRRRTARATA